MWIRGGRDIRTRRVAHGPVGGQSQALIVRVGTARGPSHESTNCEPVLVRNVPIVHLEPRMVREIDRVDSATQLSSAATYGDRTDQSHLRGGRVAYCPRQPNVLWRAVSSVPLPSTASVLKSFVVTCSETLSLINTLDRFDQSILANIHSAADSRKLGLKEPA
jgi:hypothetical protein